MTREGPVGLCPGCRHVHAVRSRTNQDYYRCERSTVDARYPKYPRLPVLRCDGYDPVEPRPSLERTRAARPGDPSGGVGRAPGSSTGA